MASCETDADGRDPGNTAVLAGADCGGASCDPLRLRKGLLGFGGTEGGGGRELGAEAGVAVGGRPCELGELAGKNGLWSGDGGSGAGCVDCG